MLKVSEIFQSIQGEGLEQGEPTTFVRVFGCNNACVYCDTKYAVKGDEWRYYETQQIKQEIEKISCRNICVTGGEPLLYIDELTNLIYTMPEYRFWVETNGTKDIV